MKSATKVNRSNKISCPDCFMKIKVKRKDLIFACKHCGCVIEIVEQVKATNITVKVNGMTCIPVTGSEFILEVRL